MKRIMVATSCNCRAQSVLLISSGCKIVARAMLELARTRDFAALFAKLQDGRPSERDRPRVGSLLYNNT